jgi:hypothetical protein
LAIGGGAEDLAQRLLDLIEPMAIEVELLASAQTPRAKGCFQ